MEISRYGFQGQEMDDEVKGEGNSVNYKYRMHDSRVGRFFAVDPLAREYPFYSPYAFSGNRVIDAVELEGLEPSPTHIILVDNDGNVLHDTGILKSSEIGEKVYSDYYFKKIIPFTNLEMNHYEYGSHLEVTYNVDEQIEERVESCHLKTYYGVNKFLWTDEKSKEKFLSLTPKHVKQDFIDAGLERSLGVGKAGKNAHDILKGGNIKKSLYVDLTELMDSKLMLLVKGQLRAFGDGTEVTIPYKPNIHSSDLDGGLLTIKFIDNDDGGRFIFDFKPFDPSKDPNYYIAKSE